MATQLTKHNPEIDGFEGFNDQIEGADGQREGVGVIKGVLVKFTNEALWMAGDEELPDLELVAVNVARIVQKWQDQQPVETIVLASGQPFPDIKALNDQVPEDEWEEGPDGKPRGPWQMQHVLYLLNIETMDRYSWPTGSVGGGIAICELVDRTNWMRRYRGANVFPVVKLADKFMNTKWGGRQRPFLQILKWIAMGGDGALPAPESQVQIERAPAAPLDRKDEPTAAPTEIVHEPSASEILDDELPDFRKPIETKRPAAKSTDARTRSSARSTQRKRA